MAESPPGSLARKGCHYYDTKPRLVKIFETPLLYHNYEGYMNQAFTKKHPFLFPRHDLYNFRCPGKYAWGDESRHQPEEKASIDDG